MQNDTENYTTNQPATTCSGKKQYVCTSGEGSHQTRPLLLRNASASATVQRVTIIHDS